MDDRMTRHSARTRERVEEEEDEREAASDNSSLQRSGRKSIKCSYARTSS